MADTLRDINTITMYRMGRDIHTKSNSTAGGEYFAQTQGMCRVGNNIVYARIPTTENASHAMLRAINPVTGSVVKSDKVFDLGHCNSMTYDSGNDMIYACRMLDDAKKLERIKYNTFSQQTALTLDYPFYACAFDNTSKKLYTLSTDGNYIDVYTQSGSTFVHSDEISYSLPKEFFSWSGRSKSGIPIL